jgi:hypothetical protein
MALLVLVFLNLIKNVVAALIVINSAALIVVLDIVQIVAWIVFQL